MARLASQAAPAPATPAPGAAPAPAKSTWSGSASVGLISLTGNTSSFTTNGTAQAERKSEHWIFGLAAGGTYGQSRPVATAEAPPEVVALNASLRARTDRRFTERYSAYLLGAIDTDHVKSIEARPQGEAGIAIIWVDESVDNFNKALVSTDLGFRVGREFRFQYYPVPVNIDDESIIAPKFGLKLRYALDKNVIFTEGAELLPTVVGPSRVLVNSVAKLTARLIAALGVGVAFELKHDSRPAAGKRDTDTALTFSLEAAF